MLSFLFTVIMLTVLFGATAGLAFIFRKNALKGRESAMYYVWLAVIILALIPIRIGEPRIILFSIENQQVQINNTAANNTLKLSELLNYNKFMTDLTDNIQVSDANANKEIQAADRAGDTDSKDAKHKNSTNIFNLIDEYKDILISGLLIIWLAGFIFVTSRIIYGYFKMKKLFYKESDICADEKINGIFNECLEIAGLNRCVNLRIMRWNFSSPCVCGLFDPTVFIDTSLNNDENDKKLKYIFIHELYHIKRYDMLYKVLSIIVAGVHWFNPMTYKVVRTIGEDCELSVDRQVMNIFGNEQSDYYMNVILDVAEQKCAVKNNRQIVTIPSASLFFGEKQNIDFLKRRYTNMKNITNKKRLIIALSLILTAIISMNIIIMSSCGIIAPANAYSAPPVVTINSYSDQNVYEAALRLYFGLLPDEEITQEQLDEITDIEIVRGITVQGAMTDNINNVSLGNMTPVSFVINGTEFNMIPSIVHKRVYEGYIEAKFIETYTSTTREVDKLNAYYTIKDPNDPDMTPEAIEELRLTYPAAFEYPIAVYDPNASTREYMYMLGMFAAAGLIDDNFVTDGTIHAGYLSNLPNLQTVTFVNLTAENVDLLPDTVDVRQENIDCIYVDRNGDTRAVWTPDTSAPPVQEQDSSNHSQPLSGVFEAPNYGINTIENYYGIPDGTEYLEFKNESLRCAIAEYFNVVDGNYVDFLPWNPVTLDMLSQITSISVRRIPEYDFVFDHPEYEVPLKGVYLEYTINGKMLDILPETYRIEGEQFFEMNSIDISQYCDKIFDGMYGDDSYHYLTKSNLSETDKLSVLSEMAKLGLMRIAIYQDENGNYFTVGRPDLFGFTARYYDQPEYDAADIAYMPNLKEFTLDGISENK